MQIDELLKDYGEPEETPVGIPEEYQQIDTISLRNLNKISKKTHSNLDGHSIQDLMLLKQRFNSMIDTAIHDIRTSESHSVQQYRKTTTPNIDGPMFGGVTKQVIDSGISK